MKQKYSIFLSCGSPDTPAQEQFLAAIEAKLHAHNCEPQTVGRSKFSGRQPVQAARDLIGSCDGAVVIAFERTRILRGLDRPELPIPKKIKDEAHPTVWNHMEASMAYAQRVPILTLVQPGLKRQGMLSDRLEWVALEKDLTPALLLTAEFEQRFDEWLNYVRENEPSRAPASVDPGEFRIGFILSQLRPSQLYKLLGAVFVILSVLASTAFAVGRWSASPGGAIATIENSASPGVSKSSR